MTDLRFVAASDPHIPHQDRRAIAWFLGHIREHMPHRVIVLGDVNEGNAASRWPNEESHELEEEYLASNEFLLAVRNEAVAANPDAQCVFVEGNHDANLRAQNRINKKLRSLTDYRKHMSELRDGHWAFVPYINNAVRGVYRIGQVTFAHGFACHKTSDAHEAVRLGKPWGLTVRAHTHRPQEVRQVVLGGEILPYWYANTGTLAALYPPMPYVERRDHSQWGNALVIGEARDLKSPREGRYWNAETKILQMAWDAQGTAKAWRSAL